MVAKRLEVVIAGDAKGAQKAMGQVEKEAGGLSSTFKKVGAGIAGAFAVGAGVTIFKDMFAGAREAAKVTALTEQVIKTTGGAANVTAGQVAKLATSISNKTAIDKDAIQSASNMIATFTSVRNEVGKGNNIFDQATQIVTDMSVALGSDMKGAAIQVGKALNDPVAGVSALAEVGVSFTQQQKDQIKAMVEVGDVAGAQKVILAELNKEFGGSGAAAATTWDKLSNKFRNIGETLAGKLLPVLDKVSEWGLTSIEWLSKHQTVTAALAVVIGGALVAAFTAWAISATAAAAATIAANAAALLIVVGLAALVAGVVLAYTHFAWFKVAVDTTWQALQTGYNWVKSNWPLLLGVLTGPFGLAVLTITRNWDSLVGFIQAIPGRIGGSLSSMWDGMKSGFRSAINWVIDKWNDFKIPAVKVLGIQVSPTINFPNIPKLHDGGVFRAPTPGGEGLALLRDRERVLTPGQSARAGFGGDGGPTVIVQITGSVVTERQLHQAIREGIRQLDREAS